ncbi:dioxygenase [Mycobacterium triplex]|uniref:Dioxygenase n=1 Tax=Mycobacterium triplex TaxID=47839 RepID=A0A024K5N7_9MYCO|nr:VOC family protein [Mycobacterium triplex]ORX04165.1 dioxygenase [Mycobacterium triplex]CDO91139.1 dioxygenase [Mycobacterium triplex]
MRRLDHVVLWTKDPRVAMDFYSRVVGLTPLRYDEFEAGEAPFPSVRVSEDSIIDLMPVTLAAGGAASASVAENSAGHPVNHVCFALEKSEYEELDQRLQAEGIDTSVRLHNSYGAQGSAPQTYYFSDPDGNVLEARYYD